MTTASRDPGDVTPKPVPADGTTPAPDDEDTEETGGVPENSTLAKRAGERTTGKRVNGDENKAVSTPPTTK